MALDGLDRDTFVEKLNSNVSASRPISTFQHLHGRESAMHTIEKALAMRGRHVFIYGERGVGKSSLAQSAANKVQSADRDFILVECSKDTTFEQIVQSILWKTRKESTKSSKSKLEFETGVETPFGLKVPIRVSQEKEARTGNGFVAPDILDSYSDALARLVGDYAATPVIVLDEFDTIERPEERAKFASLLKQLGDKDVGVKFIFSGIGDSLETLLGGHQSAIRQLETLRLERLDHAGRWDILRAVADAFQVDVPRNIEVRIGCVSDGFPYFIHLIAEKLFWVLFEHEETVTEATTTDYEKAIQDAVSGIAPHLRRKYELATRGREPVFEHVLWAMSDAYEMDRPGVAVYESYRSMMKVLGRTDIVSEDVVKRTLTKLKAESSGTILCGLEKRKGWYRFSEGMVRGYTRLVAESAGVPLQGELTATGNGVLVSAQATRASTRKKFRTSQPPRRL